MKRSRLTGNSWLACSLVIFALILSESSLKAQNTVGIGTPSPNTNAVLDLVSPNGNQGLLMPRVSTSQRLAMASSLGANETGLVVFDVDLNQFYHWVNTVWIVGLGSFSDIAGGDLQGTFPNPNLKSDVVNSATIVDGSITNGDLADISVTAGKIDGEGNGNSILGTDAAGVSGWEPKSNFLGNGLADGTLMIGDATNTAQQRTVSGDISMSNSGIVTIADNSISSSKIVDNSVTAQDIATDAVGSDELATGSVTSNEISDGTIQSVDIAAGAVTTSNIADGTVDPDDMASGGNNKVLITTGAGTVFWENISLFETSTLSEGNIFVGDFSNTASALNAKGPGRILIGDGTSVQSLNVNGDLSLSATGSAQLNSDVVSTSEVIDNSLTRDDIAPNAIESSELADNAVDNSAIQDDVISTAKIQDNTINSSKIAPDAVVSSKIADGTISTIDLSDNAVSTAKIDGEGSSNAVMTTTVGGNPQWESRSNFGTSSLPNTNIFIGDAGGASQPQPISGDITLSNAGIVQILNDVIGSAEIIDNSISRDDIGPNAVESSELADNAVDVGAIQSGAVTTTKISDDAVTVGKIDGSANNDAILTTDGAGNPQWEAKSGLDIDPTNEIQDLSLTGNTLDLTGDATTVDLSGYLDNTDGQDLTNVLGQGNSAGGSAITNTADPTNAQDVATKNYVDLLDTADTDSDPTNEIQDLSLAGNTLGLTGDATTVDLSGYLDNTDNQDLSLTGNTLSVTGDATAVDLSGYLDNTDSQDLGNVLGQGNDAGAAKIINVADPTNPQDVATMNYVDNITIINGNLAPSSVSTTEIIDGTITSDDIANNTIQQTDLANNSVGTAELRDNSVTTSKITNNAINNSKLAANSVDSGNIINNEITNTDINTSANIASSKLQSTVMVETENVSLLNNDAGYLTSVNSSSITDGSVVDADVSATASISASKLQSTVMVETENVSLLNNDAGYLTAVTSVDITDGSIVNADVNGSAAIDGSKINPDFGSQNIQTSGTFNAGGATVSSLTVTNLAGSNDTYTGDGAVNSFTISPGGVFSSSDIRLKENIEDIPQALDRLSLVEGKSYTFKSDLDQEVHFGVIAQDIQKLFPQLVHQNEDGFLSVNYLELIPVLIEALKQQQSTIEQLSQALKKGAELNDQLKAGLNKQQQLVRAQQFVLTQLQLDRAAMKKDIKEIKTSLGLEAKK